MKLASPSKGGDSVDMPVASGAGATGRKASLEPVEGPHGADAQNAAPPSNWFNGMFYDVGTKAHGVAHGQGERFAVGEKGAPAIAGVEENVEAKVGKALGGGRVSVRRDGAGVGVGEEPRIPSGRLPQGDEGGVEGPAEGVSACVFCVWPQQRVQGHSPIAGALAASFFVNGAVGNGGVDAFQDGVDVVASEEASQERGAGHMTLRARPMLVWVQEIEGYRVGVVASLLAEGWLRTG